MTTNLTILPPSATQQSRDLETALRLLAEVSSAIDLIRTSKENPPDSWLYWLIYEYGLEELLPYLPEPRRAIAEGIDWQRIRGTPESLRIALGWLGLTATLEQEIPGQHWHEFQLDTGKVPSIEELKNLVGISRLSAPVGTDISRVFHEYDIRHFILDRSDWGDLLSNYSGIYDSSLDVVLSFGRSKDIVAPVYTDDLNIAFRLGRERLTRLFLPYEDRWILDYTHLGDRMPIQNHRIMHSHAWQFVGEGTNLTNDPSDQLTIAKASVCLSDGYIIGDTNTVLHARLLDEEGSVGVLSDGFILSDQRWSAEYKPLDERFDRVATGASAYDGFKVALQSVSRSSITTVYPDKFLLDNSILCDDLFDDAIDVIIRTRTTGLVSDHFDQTWTDISWNETDKAWNELFIEMRYAHRTQGFGWLTLSEGQPLGDTNAFLQIEGTYARFDETSASQSSGYAGADMYLSTLIERTRQSEFQDRFLLSHSVLDEDLATRNPYLTRTRDTGMVIDQSEQTWTDVSWDETDKTWNTLSVEMRYATYEQAEGWLILSENSELGATNTFLKEGSLFARYDFTHDSASEYGELGTALSSHEANRISASESSDRIILSETLLDEAKPTLNPDFERERQAASASVVDVNSESPNADNETVAKSAMALSEGNAIGDTHSVLSPNEAERIDAGYRTETNIGIKPLSLSQHARSNVLFDKYEDSTTLDASRLSEMQPISQPLTGLTREKSAFSALEGQYWTDVSWDETDKDWENIFIEARISKDGNSN